jgi:hypothetical protein
MSDKHVILLPVGYSGRLAVTLHTLNPACSSNLVTEVAQIVESGTLVPCYDVRAWREMQSCVALSRL